MPHFSEQLEKYEYGKWHQLTYISCSEERTFNYDVQRVVVFFHFRLGYIHPSVGICRFQNDIIHPCTTKSGLTAHRGKGATAALLPVCWDCIFCFWSFPWNSKKWGILGKASKWSFIQTCLVPQLDLSSLLAIDITLFL